MTTARFKVKFFNGAACVVLVQEMAQGRWKAKWIDAAALLKELDGPEFDNELTTVARAMLAEGVKADQIKSISRMREPG